MLLVAVVVLVALALRAKPIPSSLDGVSKPLPSASFPTITAGPTPSVSHSSLASGASAVSLWIGDSFTDGDGAASPSKGEACLTAAAVGWTCQLDAKASTGFVAGGLAVTARAAGSLLARLPADAAAYQPSVVVIDAGRADIGLALPTVEKAISTFDAAVHADWPSAHIVQIVPYYLTSTSEPYGGALASYISSQMALVGGTVIDPIAEGWIDAESARLTIADHVHPDAAGHAYLATHLAADLQKDGLAATNG